MDALNLEFDRLPSPPSAVRREPHPGGGSPGWPEPQIDCIKACLAQGMSAQKTADKVNAEFGTNHTRCAIIGKARRMGIAFVATKERSPHRQPRANLHGAVKRIKRKRAVMVTPQIMETREIIEYGNYIPQTDLDIPVEQRKGLLELEFNHCRWPVGDPLESSFFFCGAETVEGRSYCMGHCCAAYRPVNRRY